jgi:hypothetical protein
MRIHDLSSFIPCGHAALTQINCIPPDLVNVAASTASDTIRGHD